MNKMNENKYYDGIAPAVFRLPKSLFRKFPNKSLVKDPYND